MKNLHNLETFITHFQVIFSSTFSSPTSVVAVLFLVQVFSSSSENVPSVCMQPFKMTFLVVETGV